MEPITSDDELAEIISAWYGQGILSDENLARLKARYLLDLGATTCTSCPNWKNDMLTHFRLHLRRINKTIMATTTNKYMVNPEVGSFHSPSHGTIFSNSPAATTGVTPLNDEAAEALLKMDEGYKELIILNPDYKAPAASTGEAKKKDDDKK
ncbi:hypothetical protein [Spirosoma sp. KUDC1026]|uniref:hypothetical protein n=1 Tax=Spirosoma sp. KUDC1026 TaxID=2745947 RepID=UPI00159BC447|nr:hypothetical protein [Spirosoma sp. KUDC1026]QKZ15199.1 hypothetical protein HU175_22260 [Spirosoma sp. KUDC1026]